MKSLFSSARIGHIKIKNRIIRSATSENLAKENGYVSNKLIEFYTELAQGGVGLIITGGVAIHPSSTLTRQAPCLFNDNYLNGHKKLVAAVHDVSECKIAAQLVHTGRLTGNRKYEPVAPSPIPDKVFKRVPRELQTEEVKEIIMEFVSAGRRAFESGYDAIQLHAAHGYLLSNFISPYSNKRADLYGGTIQKRAKILIDICDQLKEEVGKNFPVTVKLQTQDGVSGGLSLEEGKEIARLVANAGFDAIEPSGGGIESMTKQNGLPSRLIKLKRDENYFLPTVVKIKPVTGDCSLILMGGIRDPLSADKLLFRKSADFISMSRPLIYEPNLPQRWMKGDTEPAFCTSCNACYLTTTQKNSLCCIYR